LFLVCQQQEPQYHLCSQHTAGSDSLAGLLQDQLFVRVDHFPTTLLLLKTHLILSHPEGPEVSTKQVLHLNHQTLLIVQIPHQVMMLAQKLTPMIHLVDT